MIENTNLSTCPYQYLRFVSITLKNPYNLTKHRALFYLYVGNLVRHNKKMAGYSIGFCAFSVTLQPRTTNSSFSYTKPQAEYVTEEYRYNNKRNKTLLRL